MKSPKFETVDIAYELNYYPDLWIYYHNFLVKYKNYDRIHLQACELYDRHFFDEEGLESQSRIGSFIRACITAGYAKAKLEFGQSDQVSTLPTLPLNK